MEAGGLDGNSWILLILLFAGSLASLPTTATIAHVAALARRSGAVASLGLLLLVLLGDTIRAPCHRAAERGRSFAREGVPEVSEKTDDL